MTKISTSAASAQATRQAVHPPPRGRGMTPIRAELDEARTKLTTRTETQS
jgi:hypothetical protein